MSAIIEDVINWSVPLIRCDSEHFDWPPDVKKIMNLQKKQNQVSEKLEKKSVVDPVLPTGNQSPVRSMSLEKWKFDTYFNSLEQNRTDGCQRHNSSTEQLTNFSESNIKLTHSSSFDTQSNSSSVESMDIVMYPSESVLLEIENSKRSKTKLLVCVKENDKEISEEWNQSSKRKKNEMNISEKLQDKKCLIKGSSKLKNFKNTRKQEKRNRSKKKSKRSSKKHKSKEQFSAMQKQDTSLDASYVEKVKLKTDLMCLDKSNKGNCETLIEQCKSFPNNDIQKQGIMLDATYVKKSELKTNLSSCESKKGNYSTFTEQIKYSLSKHHTSSNKQGLSKYKIPRLSNNQLNKNKPSLENNSKENITVSNFMHDQTNLLNAIHTEQCVIKKRTEVKFSQEQNEKSHERINSIGTEHVANFSSEVLKQEIVTSPDENKPSLKNSSKENLTVSNFMHDQTNLSNAIHNEQCVIKKRTEVKFSQEQNEKSHETSNSIGTEHVANFSSEVLKQEIVTPPDENKPFLKNSSEENLTVSKFTHDQTNISNAIYTEQCAMKRAEVKFSQERSEQKDRIIHSAGTENVANVSSKFFKQEIVTSDKNSKQHSVNMLSHSLPFIKQNSLNCEKSNILTKSQGKHVRFKEAVEYALNHSEHDTNEIRNISVDMSYNRDSNCLDLLGSNSHTFNFHKISSKAIISCLDYDNIGAEGNKRYSDAVTSTESNKINLINAVKFHSNVENEDLYLKLIKIILEMNPNQLYESEVKSKFPPNMSKGGTLLPLHFDSYSMYVSSFFPMLILETWEEICFHSKPVLKFKSLNKFYFSVISYEYVNGLTMLSCESIVNENLSFIPSKNNVVILYLKQECSSWTPTFGFIINNKSIVLDVNNVSTHKWQHLPPEWLNNAKMWSFNVYVKSQATTVTNCLMEGKGICNLEDKINVTHALSFLKFSPLLKDILTPNWNTFFVSYTEALVSDYMCIQQNIANAVCDVMKIPSSEKILLLEGPPGSGKTNAIVAISEKLSRYSSLGQKILVVAPSNLAVDKIGLQLVLHNDLNISPVNFIRFGHTENMNPKLVDYSVSKNLEKRRTKYESVYNLWQSDYIRIKNELFHIHQKARNKHYDEKLKIVEAKYRRVQEKEIKKWDHSIEQQQIERVFKNSSVILATLDDCFQLLKMKHFLKFSCCIIDETNQATELDILFLFILGIHKFLLVGDSMQLSADIKSDIALNCGFQRSILERFQLYFKNQHQLNPAIILSKQFRMHTEISHFPLNYFYSQNPIQCSYGNNWSNCFRSYIVFDDRSEFCAKTLSMHKIMNPTNIIIPLCSYIIKNHSVSSIGIIVSSKEERELYLSAVDKNLPPFVVEVDTVEGFQGSEKSVIIISCFQNFPSNPNEFFYNARKLNVALTRAVNSLIICGPLHCLTSHALWKALIANARVRGCYVPYTYENNIFSLFRTYLKT